MKDDLARFQLTAKQATFVKTLVETGDRVRAVSEAGYIGDPFPIIWRSLRTPSVIAAIRYQTAIRLQEVAPVAITVLFDILGDKAAPKGVRVDAAKTLLDRAGYVPPKAREPEGNDDAVLNEMSLDELRLLVSEIQRKRGEAAKALPMAVRPAPALADLID